MPDEREKQVIFAMQPGQSTPDGVPVLTFLMSPAAWEYMHTGKGHDFDLTKAGIPLKVVIGRCKNRKHGLEILNHAIKASGERVVDMQDHDFGFDKEPKKGH